MVKTEIQNRRVTAILRLWGVISDQQLQTTFKFSQMCLRFTACAKALEFHVSNSNHSNVPISCACIPVFNHFQGPVTQILHTIVLQVMDFILIGRSVQLVMPTHFTGSCIPNGVTQERVKVFLLD